MVTLIVVSFLVLLVAVSVIALVVVGQEGMFEDRMPGFAARARRAAAHLNGNEAPPQKFVEAVSDPRVLVRDGVQHVSSNVRQMRSRLVHN